MLPTDKSRVSSSSLLNALTTGKSDARHPLSMTILSAGSPISIPPASRVLRTAFSAPSSYSSFSSEGAFPFPCLRQAYRAFPCIQNPSFHIFFFFSQHLDFCINASNSNAFSILVIFFTFVFVLF